MQWYLFVSYGISSSLALFFLLDINYEIKNWIMFTSLVSVFVIGAFLAIFSIIYALIQLRNPGIGSQIKSLIFKRHIMTLFLYWIFQMYALMSVISIFLSDKWDEKVNKSIVINTFKMIGSIQGFIIPILRASEPYFYQVIFKKYFNCKKN